MEIRILESAKEDLREGWRFYERHAAHSLLGVTGSLRSYPCLATDIWRTRRQFDRGAAMIREIHSDLLFIGNAMDARDLRPSIGAAVERAKVLARALRCHPAVLLFPGWDVDKESAA